MSYPLRKVRLLIRAISAALCAAITLVPTAAIAAPIPVSDTPTSTVNERAKKQCNDPLVGILKKAGFRGQSVHIAWAIAMRESNGNPTVISPSDDFGLLQLNRPTWGGQSWWNDSMMLDGVYNARMAYLHITHKGKDWRMWGIGTDGSTDATYYPNWDQWQIDNWITVPFQKYYSQFPSKCS